MSSTIRRLLVTGAAVAMLAVLAIGVASAAGLGAAPRSPLAAAAASGAPAAAPSGASTSGEGATDDAIDSFLKNHPAVARRLGRLAKAADRVVHVEATVTDKDGNLVHLQLDHGTIQSIGSGTIVIAEAGGGTVTVATNGDTKVRVGTKLGSLADLKVGNEIYVHSRVDGSTTLAKRVIRFDPVDATSN